MKNKINLTPKQRNKVQLRQKFLLATGASIVTAMIIFIGFKYEAENKADYFNPDTNSNTKVYYNWDSDVKLAKVGPNAIDISKDARIDAPGSLNSGLNPGSNLKDINLEIPKQVLDVEGVEISIDFQRDEPDGYFISRGDGFLFGMRKGKLGIRYTISTKKKGKETISANNIFDIPDDDTFRNYRFKYDQNLGIGYIYVNNKKVWESKKRPNSPLVWKKNASIWVGKYMNGEGKNNPIMDNLVINEIKNS